MFSAITLALWLVSISCAWGQTGNGDENTDFADMSLKELTEMEVFDAASLLPTQRNKAPGTVYSFSREDFVRLGVRRLDDLLSFVPGLQINQYRKRHRNIWSRGLIDRFNDKMVLMVDGIRRQHVYYGNFSLGDNFPLEKIEKVEIILGPASSIYGANAYGGIISVTTRNYTNNRHIEATAEGGDNARGKGTLLYNSEKVQVFGSYLSQDAPFREDRKSFFRGGEVVQPLDEDYANLFLKAAPFDGLTVTADYYRNNTPFLFIPKNQDAFVKEDSLTLAALYEKGDIDTGKIQANFFYTWDKTREYEINNALRGLRNNEYQNAAFAGSTITGFKRLFDDHVLALGFNWMRTAATNMDYVRRFYIDELYSPPKTGSLLSNPNVRNNDYAVYIQDVWSIHPKIDLTFGGRLDKFEQFGSHFNYRAALVFTPDERQTLKLLYGTAIRTPTFREYLKVLEGTDFAPPIPDPERLETVELGYLYHWDRVNLSLTLFNNEVHDYIHEVPAPGGDEYFANSKAPWEMRGVEALLQFKPSEEIDLRWSSAYLHGVERGNGKLPYLSNWTSNFSLNYNYLEDHRLGFSLLYQSSRTDTNNSLSDNPNAFLIANIFGSGRFNRYFSYAFGIDNVFDSRIHDPAADFGNQYNPERSAREIWGRLTWSFDP